MSDEVGMTNTNETAAPRLIMFQRHQQKPNLSDKHHADSCMNGRLPSVLLDGPGFVSCSRTLSVPWYFYSY